MSDATNQPGANLDDSTVPDPPVLENPVHTDIENGNTPSPEPMQPIPPVAAVESYCPLLMQGNRPIGDMLCRQKSCSWYVINAEKNYRGCAVKLLGEAALKHPMSIWSPVTTPGGL